MSAVEAAIRVIVDLLIRGEYATIDQITRGRLPAADLRSAVSRYGRVLVQPDEGWWETVQVTPIDGVGDQVALHIAAPLWTREEGRSDLTLELRLSEIAPELYDTEVLDVRVM